MEYLPAWMFLALTILLMAGFPVTFTLLGTALCFGLIGFGWNFFNLLPLRIWGVMINVTLIKNSKRWSAHGEPFRKEPITTSFNRSSRCEASGRSDTSKTAKLLLA